MNIMEVMVGEAEYSDSRQKIYSGRDYYVWVCGIQCGKPVLTTGLNSSLSVGI